MASQSASKTPKIPFSGNTQMLQSFWNHLVLDIFRFFITVCMAANETSKLHGGAGTLEMSRKTFLVLLRCNAMEITNMNPGVPTKMPMAKLFFLRKRKLHIRSCCVIALRAFSRTKLFVVALLFLKTWNNKSWRCQTLPADSCLQRSPKGRS